MRMARAKLKLTQDAFAHEAGLNGTYLGKIERGESSPTLAVLQKICDVLNIPVSEFIALAEKPDSERK